MIGFILTAIVIILVGSFVFGMIVGLIDVLFFTPKYSDHNNDDSDK